MSEMGVAKSTVVRIGEGRGGWESSSLTRPKVVVVGNS